MLMLLGPLLVTFAVALAAGVVSIAVLPALPRHLSAVPVLLGCVAGMTAAHSLLPDRSLLPSVIASTALVVASAAYVRLRPMLTGPGAVLWVTYLAFGATATTWGVLFLSSLSLSVPTTVLLWATVGLAAVTLPSAVVTTREGWEPLLRRRWLRPSGPVTVSPARPPRVSIHVPCHAEPPEIVIATLDRLAALDYPNFEVLVVDNNTLDPGLWEPVRNHCVTLGNRFRFLHVEGITGAKAGALNWALTRTDPAAEIVAVVDADYQVEREWLRCTVGYFDDPRMGFVQGPHAYRNYADSVFGRWANWEYSVFFHAGMVSLNEHNAGLTVGTMSLIRRQVLEDVGGWAEWCLTEDSELAVRIHAAGYDSVYLTEKYGRGLIPQTFTAYRRQRFRWTYGPVQEFRHHWRLFLPRWLGGTPSRLTRAQKLHHANHGIDVICVGLRALTVPLAIGAAASMVVHHERIPVPVELWAAATSGLLASLVIRYLVYSRVVGATIRQAIGGTIAFAALSLVIATGSLKASTGRPATWQRTPKFQTVRSGVLVLGQVRAETAAAVACLLGAVVLLATTPLGGVLTMLAIGLAGKAVGYLTAAAVAITADRSLPRAQPVRGAHRRRAVATNAGAWAGALGLAATVVLITLSVALNSTDTLHPRANHGGALGGPGHLGSTDRPGSSRSATGSPATSQTSSPARTGGSGTSSANVAFGVGRTTTTGPTGISSGTVSRTATSSSAAATTPVPAPTPSTSGVQPSSTPSATRPKPSSTAPSRRPTATPTPTNTHGGP
jgi:hypothetical protein